MIPRSRRICASPSACIPVPPTVPSLRRSLSTLGSSYDETVRGADVFLIQSVAGGNVNDMLMELLIATDAAKRASARSITAVITHYGYARQDRKAW